MAPAGEEGVPGRDCARAGCRVAARCFCLLVFFAMLPSRSLAGGWRVARGLVAPPLTPQRGPLRRGVLAALLGRLGPDAVN